MPIFFDNINPGGIATLSDGSRWRVSPPYLALAAAWSAGTEVEIVINRHFIWKNAMENVETRERVLVIPSPKLHWQK